MFCTDCSLLTGQLLVRNTIFSFVTDFALGGVF